MKISVALCTYNGEQFIGEQLDSIFAQTLPVNEIIICDDNSADHTYAILENYKNKYPNVVIIYKNENSLGTVKNFEKAISLTTGDLIFLSDQDDIWYQNKVKLMTTYFIKNVKCKLLFTDGDLIDQNGEKLNSTLWEKWGFNKNEKIKWKNNTNAFFELLDNRNKITGATVCFEKDLKKSFPIITYPFYYHDAFLGLHASAKNGLFFLDKSLIKYRIHTNQQIGILNGMSTADYLLQNKDTITKKKFVGVVLNTYRFKKLLYIFSIIKERLIR